MTKRYELIYGYLHCTGRTMYRAGFVETEAEAREWVERQQEKRAGRMKPPPEDPIRNCGVSYCPLKTQQPWFAWREAVDEQ
jgi:hypothetical protein